MLRFVFSALLTVLFVATFVAYLILSSMVSYVDDDDHLLESAATFDLRGELIELTTEVLTAEVRGDPELAQVSESQMRVIITSVITEDWVRRTIKSSHKGIRQALRGFEDEAAFDFRETKAALRDAANSLEERALRNCEEALGADSCGDLNQARQKAQRYQERALGAIAALPDRIDLTSRLSSKDQRRAKKLTDGLRTIEKLETITLALLIGILIALGLLNARRLHTLLLALGVALGLGCLSYFAAVSMTQGKGAEALEEALAEHRAGPIASFSGRFMVRVLDDALSTSHSMVVLLTLASLLMLAGGTLLWRRVGDA